MPHVSSMKVKLHLSLRFVYFISVINEVSEVCPGSIFSVSSGSWVHGEMHPLQQQSIG